MGSSIRIVELKRSLKMYDQLRLEKYGLCCKMKVTTVVSILGWVGLVSSILESLILLILPIVLWSLLRAYVWAIVMFLICSPIFLFSLITRGNILHRQVRGFSGNRITQNNSYHHGRPLHFLVFCSDLHLHRHPWGQEEQKEPYQRPHHHQHHRGAGVVYSVFFHILQQNIQAVFSFVGCYSHYRPPPHLLHHRHNLPSSPTFLL